MTAFNLIKRGLHFVFMICLLLTPSIAQAQDRFLGRSLPPWKILIILLGAFCVMICFIPLIKGLIHLLDHFFGMNPKEKDPEEKR